VNRKRIKSEPIPNRTRPDSESSNRFSMGPRAIGQDPY
jgi:hypothetical protein